MRDNKGFTLAEILGIIVIIGLLLMLSAPLISNRIKSNKDKTEESGYELVYNATEQYIMENSDLYPNGKNYCVDVSELVDKGKLVSPVLNITTGDNIENKSILVKKSITGYTSYAIYEKNECEKVSIIGPIEFEFQPKMGIWGNETSVTIIYPNERVDRYRHSKDTGDNWIDDGDKIIGSNRRVGEVFQDNGEIIAEIEYQGVVIREKRKITNVDKISPSITLNPSGSGWINDTDLEIKITDKESGLGQGYVRYGWSSSENEEPSSWNVINFERYQKGQHSVTAKIDKSIIESLSGVNYLWIDDFQDAAGNKANKKSWGRYQLDTGVPTIQIINANCSGGKVTIKFSDDGGSGLKNYSLSETSKTNESIVWTELENKEAIELNVSRYASKYYIYVQDVAGNIGSLEYNPFIPYRITLNPNGGMVDPININVQNFRLYDNLPIPTKTGYSFGGWYTALDGGTKVTNTTKVCLDDNQTLYARWQKSVLYGKYDMNGGSLASNHGEDISTSGSFITLNGKTDIKLGEYGDKIAENGLLNYNNSSGVNIKRTGYTAKKNEEWIINSKTFDQDIQYNVSDFDDISSGDKTVVLKVNWVANSYTIKFNGNGSTSGSTANKSCKYASNCELTSNGFSRTGYTFTGWNKKSDGTGTSYTNEAVVKNLTSTQDGVVTLYAQWRKN